MRTIPALIDPGGPNPRVKALGLALLCLASCLVGAGVVRNSATITTRVPSLRHTLIHPTDRFGANLRQLESISQLTVIRHEVERTIYGKVSWAF